MLAAWMQRLENLCVAIAFAEAGEYETAYALARAPAPAAHDRPQG